MIVKIHAGVAAVLIRHGLDKAYFVWLIARHVSDGSGKCSIKMVKTTYMEIMGVSEKTFYNHLNSGYDILYSKSSTGDFMFIKSLSNIVSKFDPVLAFASCVEVDLSWLLCAGVKPVQVLVSSIVAADKYKKPISLFYLANSLNKDRSFVKRNISGVMVKRVRNIINGRTGWNSYELLHGRYLSNKTEHRDIRFFVREKNRKIKLCNGPRWEIKQPNYW